MMSLLTKWKAKYRQNRKSAKMKAFYRQFIKSGDLCFDIGANLGHRSEIFLALGAHVVAVEPHPQCFHGLKEKFAQDDRIHLENIGISDVEGTETFQLSNVSDVSTFSTQFIQAYSGQPGIDWNKRISVEVITLNDLIEKHGIPKFIKLDIEGYEGKALQALNHPIQSISFEHNNKLLENSILSINSLGALGNYKFRLSPYESMKFIDEKWLNQEGIKEQLVKYQAEILTGDVYAQLSS